MAVGQYRVEIYSHGASHGPGELKAVIDDPRDLGVSEYANDVGEFFMTLPVDHPDIGQIVPLQRHYKVMRHNGTAYSVVGSGVVEDFAATATEAVIYGHDYMGLLETSLTGSNESTSGTALGTIVNSNLTAAIGETNSRLAFTSLGTIETTSITVPALSSYQPRIDFIRSLADISMSDRSVRTMLKIPRVAPWQWSFTENYGQQRRKVRLEYGGLVSDFGFTPGYRDFATRIRAIGVKQEGATLLFSDQTYASEATYGRIVRPALFQNIIDQTALDRKTKREARRAARTEKNVQVVLRAGAIAPYTTYEVGDYVPVKIQRGSLVNVASYFTIWGQEWTVDPLGRESLFLDLSTTDT